MSIKDQMPISEKSSSLQSIADMRFVSNGIGLVYEAQVEQLKKLANLFFHPEVAVISIEQPTRSVTVEVECLENSTTARFPEAVRYVLGDSWSVKMLYQKPKRKKSVPPKKVRKWKKKR